MNLDCLSRPAYRCGEAMSRTPQRTASGAVARLASRTGLAPIASDHIRTIFFVLGAREWHRMITSAHETADQQTRRCVLKSLKIWVSTRKSSSYGMEARVGIEPTNKGFADLCLASWLPCRLLGLRRLGARGPTVLARRRDAIIGRATVRGAGGDARLPGGSAQRPRACASLCPSARPGLCSS